MSEHQEKVSRRRCLKAAGEPPLIGVTCLRHRVDVVICLSTTVRNDTLQDVREQRVSLKCRKQLRVEELEMVSSVYNPVWS